MPTPARANGELAAYDAGDREATFSLHDGDPDARLELEGSLPASTTEASRLRRSVVQRRIHAPLLDAHHAIRAARVRVFAVALALRHVPKSKPQRLTARREREVRMSMGSFGKHSGSHTE